MTKNYNVDETHIFSLSRYGRLSLFRAISRYPWTILSVYAVYVACKHTSQHASHDRDGVVQPRKQHIVVEQIYGTNCAWWIFLLCLSRGFV